MYWSLLEAISRDLERMSAGQRPHPGREQAVRQMPVNLYQSEHAITVTTELPGVSPEEVEVTVDDGVLSLVAERKPVELGDQDVPVVQEQVHGKQARRVRLPFPVDAGGIAARMKNGVLQVTLPKRADAKPRRIDIATG